MSKPHSQLYSKTESQKEDREKKRSVNAPPRSFLFIIVWEKGGGGDPCSRTCPRTLCEHLPPLSGWDSGQAARLPLVSAGASHCRFPLLAVDESGIELPPRIKSFP